MVQKTKTSIPHVCTHQEEASREAGRGKRKKKREDDSATFLNTGGQIGHCGEGLGLSTAGQEEGSAWYQRHVP